MELDLEILADLLGRPMNKEVGDYLGELLEAPFMVFARVVTWKVGRSDIRDRFGVDAYNLC